jgi:small subunit ribosomal protein S4
MAIDRCPILKRCRTLGIEPAFLGISKKSKKKPPVSRRKVSEYGLQMKEKQKAKFVYGILEKQFRLYFTKAAKMRGIVGENLLVLLEYRLDNVAFRMGFARTRREARQIVGHKLLTVNGKSVNIPSYLVKPGDVIAVKESMRTSERFKDIAADTSGRRPPAWLETNLTTFQGSILARPERDQIDTPVNETLIVEFYSK